MVNSRFRPWEDQPLCNFSHFRGSDPGSFRPFQWNGKFRPWMFQPPTYFRPFTVSDPRRLQTLRGSDPRGLQTLGGSDPRGLQTLVDFRPSWISDPRGLQTLVDFRPSWTSDPRGFQTLVDFRPSKLNCKASKSQKNDPCLNERSLDAEYFCFMVRNQIGTHLETSKRLIFQPNS